MVVRKASIVWVVILFCSIGALAQNQPENPCVNDNTTADGGANAGIRMCFAELQQRMTNEIQLLVEQHAKELYAAARKSLSELQTPGDTRSANQIPLESAKLFRRSARALELSQIRWKIYREGYCAAVRSEWTVGSGAPGAYQECMYNLAVQRKKDILRDFDNLSDAK